MREQDYTYEERSRRPLTILAWFIGLIMLGVAVNVGAQWWFYLPIGLFMLMVTWMLIADKVSGMRLEGADLELYSGKWQRKIVCEEIVSMDIKEWSDSAPTITLRMRDGENIAVPGMCFGAWKTFANALEQRGVVLNTR